ncbi:MAG: type II/IV secretion system ATPase subunit [Halobacteriales archaeon]
MVTLSRLEALKQRLTAPAQAFRKPSFVERRYDPREHGPLVSWCEPDASTEIERYWVDPPYAFVSILQADGANEHRYHVVEPDLTDREETLLDDLLDDLRQALIHREQPKEGSAEAAIETELAALLAEYGLDVSRSTFFRFFYYLTRHFRGYRQLDPVMRDPHVEDISCDGAGRPLFVYHSEYTDLRTNLTFEADQLDDFVVRLAQRAGQHVSIGEPIAHAMLPDGSRAELAFGEEVTPHGSAFTIRRYADVAMTPVSLLNRGTFSIEQLAYLWLAIEHNRSLIFAGGTAAGKTTSLNAVSLFIPPRAKVLSIEDTPEIRLHHENWLSAVTREGVGDDPGVGMYELLRSALRHRPEYIIVGEVRGSEAMTLFQAMNTGHATYSTLHADSIQTVIKRLENDPINVPRAMIRSLDILSVQTIHHRGGERWRRARELTEIVGVDQRTGDLDYTTVFEWEPSDDRFRKNLGQSQVLEVVAERRGWTGAELRRELRERQRILRFARLRDLTDYEPFTALVTDYYTDPDPLLARADAALGGTAASSS